MKTNKDIMYKRRSVLGGAVLGIVAVAAVLTALSVSVFANTPSTTSTTSGLGNLTTTSTSITTSSSFAGTTTSLVYPPVVSYCASNRTNNGDSLDQPIATNIAVLANDLGYYKGQSWGLLNCNAPYYPWNSAGFTPSNLSEMCTGNYSNTGGGQVVLTPDQKGFWILANTTVAADGFFDNQLSFTSIDVNGLVCAYGDAQNLGNALAYNGNGGAQPYYSDFPICNVIGMASDNNQNSQGYWIATTSGDVYSYGSANFYGSLGNVTLNQPIVGIASTPDGKGYWLVASDGGIFAFGDAQFYGSMGGKPLNKPIMGIAPTADGKGYWEVASDGGVFSFGDATFYGSTGNLTLVSPVVSITATPDGQGYYLYANDGGLFAYGDAHYYG